MDDAGRCLWQCMHVIAGWKTKPKGGVNGYDVILIFERHCLCGVRLLLFSLEMCSDLELVRDAYVCLRFVILKPIYNTWMDLQLLLWIRQAMMVFLTFSADLTFWWVNSCFHWNLGWTVAYSVVKMMISLICCFWVNCHLDFMDFCHFWHVFTSQGGSQATRDVKATKYMWSFSCCVVKRKEKGSLVITCFVELHLWWFGRFRTT